ncbi:MULTISPECIES: thioredoxin family protein [Sulfurimonas]|uniref:thioredoxin family protein n=1 Tax=Sulfurimonas TaxID=202746 RepID=UPI001264F0CC|nr:thioredoxin family protein [Sulfurimonas indica]
MRYIVSMILLAVTLMATELQWLDNYNVAMEKAKKENKLIYIFISSSTCGWCDKFEKTTLQDENVKKRLKKEFVPVHLVREFDDVPQKFATAPVPRHYFTDSKGNILYNSLGYRKVDTFESFMDNAQEKFTMTKEKK